MNGAHNAQEPNPFDRMSAQERLAFATLIRQARQARGLNQAELAEIAGVSRNTVVNVERARTAPQAAVLSKFAEALELTPDPISNYPSYVQDWINLTAPLFERIQSDAVRSVVLGETLTRLGQALKEQGHASNS